MHALNDVEMLDLWEAGAGREPVGRALLVLAAATDTSMAELAVVPIPRRDALLFDARRLAFGDELRAVVACPACAEPLEFTTTVGAFAPVPLVGADAVVVELGALRATVRVPTSADLFAVRDASTVADARDDLLARCIDSLERDGCTVPFEDLDADAIAALADAASEHPALTDFVLDLTCAACGFVWQSPFDVATFLWEEIRASASRLLPEIHLIARAYGWSERDILALGPLRRARYLALIEAET